MFRVKLKFEDVPYVVCSSYNYLDFVHWQQDDTDWLFNQTIGKKFKCITVTVADVKNEEHRNVLRQLIVNFMEKWASALNLPLPMDETK